MLPTLAATVDQCFVQYYNGAIEVTVVIRRRPHPPAAPRPVSVQATVATTLPRISTVHLQP